MTPPSAPRDRFRLAFACCALAALLPLWSVKYLPMVDLPQHAALLSIWQHLRDPAFGFEGKYYIHWFTPYLLGYCLARLFMTAMSILAALKMVLSLYVVALPLSFGVLFRRAGVDRWWALVGFPLAYGACFYWGFFNYLIATPIAILFLAFAYRYSVEPTRRRGLWLALFAFVLFFAHAILFAICGLVAALWVILRAPSPKLAARRVTALVLPLPPILLWTWLALGQAQTHVPVLLAWSRDRIAWLPVTMLGWFGDQPARLVGAVLLLLPLCVLKPRRSWAAWASVAAILLGMLLAPDRIFGTSFIYPRFAVFLFPLLLLALEPGRTLLRPSIVRGMIAALSVTWCLVLVSRFAAFDEQARDFDVIASHMRPNAAVRPIIAFPFSEFDPGGVPYLHFPCYYQMEKGGLNGFSFADSEFSFVRYRPPLHNRMHPDDEWHPELFRWYAEPAYDYYVVRALRDLGPVLFRGAEASMRLEAHQGCWWLYRPVAPLQRLP